MRLFFYIGLIILWASGGEVLGAASGGSAKHGPAVTGILRLVDGSELHGDLLGLEMDEQLEWRHPSAQDPIRFDTDQVESIRLNPSEAVLNLPDSKCLFRFHNGDAIFGDLRVLDRASLKLRTWLGDELSAKRKAVRSITFFPGGYSVLYAGPTGLDGWNRGRNGRAWQYHDGAFVTQGGGSIGKKFDLKESSSVEFDMAWNGRFGLVVALQTEMVHELNYRADAYKFYIRPGAVSLQRIKAGDRIHTLGQAQLPQMLHKNEARVGIRANRADASLTLTLDGEVIERWKDKDGFAADGPGIVFGAQRTGPTVRISNLKVATWEGNFTPLQSTNDVVETDLMYLVNHDKIKGSLKRLKGGAFEVETAHLDLGVPKSRVSQVYLQSTNRVSRSLRRGEVRAHFWGGGSISFGLEKWTARSVVGRSPEFGRLNFDPRSIRRVDFNLTESDDEEASGRVFFDSTERLEDGLLLENVFQDTDD